MESKLPQVIGVAGRKFNGKDTFSDRLVEKYGYVKVSYAEPIKVMCKTLFGFTDEQLYGSKKEELDQLVTVFRSKHFCAYKKVGAVGNCITNGEIHHRRHGEVHQDLDQGVDLVFPAHGAEL